jgi:hypothetical protein
VKTLANKMCQFWASVESFQCDQMPTSFERLAAQLRCAKKYAEMIVTFDCYHYLNPLGFSHDPVHKAVEEKLYAAYKGSEQR